MNKIPWIFMGTFQNKDFDLLLNHVQIGIQNGVFGFDTAPSYKSEGVLGKVLKTLMTKGVVKREDIFISDKVDAWQINNAILYISCTDNTTFYDGSRKTDYSYEFRYCNFFYNRNCFWN